jgi:acyl-CoA synthetase (AMP-forming)/AMP-acid ligase II
LVRAGVLRPGRPDVVAKQLKALAQWGPTPAAGYRAAAARYGDATAVVDDHETVTFADFEGRATRLAHALAELGAGPEVRVALLCRNHSLLLEAIVACSSLGAAAVLANTGMSSEQVRATVEDLNVRILLTDAEFLPTLGNLAQRVRTIVGWSEPGETVIPHRLTASNLVAEASTRPLKPPPRPGRTIVLTSGTTGVPLGARRPNPPGLAAAAPILSRIPLRAGERMFVSSPLFHTWGFAAIQVGMALHATLVLRRRFDPEQALRTVAEQQVTAMFVVPVMLQRILDLPKKVRDSYDTSSLRVIASSGSALPAHCVTGVLDAFGNVLYNLYGSTEVSWASIATPTELRAHPTTAGRPPLGTRVAILDDDGHKVPTGSTGRIFVGNDMLFDGYTAQRRGDGDAPQATPHKERHGGLMATGDLGWIDEDGLLYVAGRDDDMIVSGGENAFPREVEDVIAALDGVREVAVTGVPDETFGQRFVAYVAVEPGKQGAVGGESGDQRGGLTADDVKAAVKSRLAAFSVPRDVVFVDALPRNATGKVVLRELPKPPEPQEPAR